MITLTWPDHRDPALTGYTEQRLIDDLAQAGELGAAAGARYAAPQMALLDSER